MKNKSTVLLNMIFALSIILAAYTLIKVYYLDKKNILPGLCPVNNRTLIFITIGFLFLYYILSALYDKKRKIH